MVFYLPPTFNSPSTSLVSLASISKSAEKEDRGTHTDSIDIDPTIVCLNESEELKKLSTFVGIIVILVFYLAERQLEDYFYIS